MSRVRDAIERANASGRAALIGYLTAGDPALEVTPRLARAMAEGGCDVLEIGVPFSDPTADGPVIQRASERALRQKTTLRGVLDSVRALRQHTDVPVVLFGYANPFLRYGPGPLAADAAAAGVDGFLVVDLPPEECEILRAPVVAAGLDWVPLVAPTTPPERAARIASLATAFVYLVSTLGVTGKGGVDLRAAGERAAALSKAHGIPVAVGFGVSSGEDAALLASTGADAIVVGSAFVRRIEASGELDVAANAVAVLAAELHDGARRPAATPWCRRRGADAAGAAAWPAG